MCFLYTFMDNQLIKPILLIMLVAGIFSSNHAYHYALESLCTRSSNYQRSRSNVSFSSDRYLASFEVMLRTTVVSTGTTSSL